VAACEPRKCNCWLPVFIAKIRKLYLSDAAKHALGITTAWAMHLPFVVQVALA
jgi:hypothetical protein